MSKCCQLNYNFFKFSLTTLFNSYLTRATALASTQSGHFPEVRWVRFSGPEGGFGKIQVRTG